jgi:hypothetical protein
MAEQAEIEVAKAPTRTFSVESRRVPGDWIGQNDGGENFVIIADPLERRQPDGSLAISMGWPMLVVTDWTGNAEGLAALVARLLAEHFAKASA